jgi:hypothetical protein
VDLGCSVSHLVRESTATGIGIERVVLVGPSTNSDAGRIFHDRCRDNQ